MTKLLALMFILTIKLVLTYLHLTKGWGMVPQSWWWIIGCGLIGQAFITSMANYIGKDNK